jgi:hypothetical protein
MFSTRKILLLVPLSTIAALGLMPAIGNAATAGDISVSQVLNTSPLWADAQSYHACNVVNVSTSPVAISVEIIESNGGALTSSGAITLAAGTSYELAVGPGYVGFARCRLTLNLPGAIRANLTVFHSLGSGTYETYATSEAR